MKKRLYLIAAAALALVACAKEEAYQSTESTIPGAKRIVLGASFELPGDPTKSDYDADGNFTWSNDDAIWIGSNETNGDKKWGSGPIIKGQSEIGPGHATAQFDCTLQGDVTAIAAVFPKTVEPSYSAGTLSLTLPATIAWTDTQLANPANATMQVDNIMVARYVDIYSGGYAHGTTQNIQFHNVGGLFCLTLKNVPAGADKLVFTADKKINGTFTVSNVDDSKDGKNYPVIATAATETESEKSVTITFPTISNGENKMTFFIPVPVGSYVIGFDVQNAEAKSLWAFSASKPNAVERGYIIKMPTLSHVIVGGSGDGATNIITTPTGFSGTVNLPSTNNSIYVRMNQTGGAITLAYADAPALHPANVYLQALGNVETLNINLPDSHVELTGEDAVQHVITNVSSYTSYSTLKVDKKVKIGKDEDKNSGITITGGSLDLDAPVEGKVTVNIPAANNNKTEEKVAINITSAIKDLVVTRAADNVTPADKVYVSLGNGASVAETIDVPEVNCNLYVAPGVTVKVIDTKAAENTVEGDVQTLSASGASTIVTVTSEANVTTKIEATGGATIIVDENALKDDNDNAYASANNQTKDENSTITTVDTGSVALVGNTGYDTLAKAINAADNGATITIIKAGEYDALPALTKTLTFVSSVDGVIINQTKNAEIDAEKTVTFKNIAFNLSDVQYLGFGKKSDSANGALVMEGCTIEGSLSLYGKSTFTDCKFTANGKYNIWAVLADASFSGCSFTNTNRAVNVYDFKHGISVKNVSFSGCTFAGTEKKKAAINIHHNPDGTVAKYAVTITNCTTSGTWASSVAETGEPADATICNSALWMVSDIKNWTSGDITVTVDGVSQTIIDSSVAKIGDTKKYDTLAEAIDAVPANTPTTITMIANAMINVAGSALTVPTNKVITLDLNGFQVVGTAETGNTSELIRNNGTLTIKDSSDSNADGTGTGKLISGATPTWTWDGSNNYAGSYASNLIRNDGTLNVESGLLYNASTGSAAYAIDNYGAARITINGGAVDAKKASAIRLFYQNGGSIVVNGGIIGHYNDDNDRSYMALQVMGSAGKGVSVTLNGGEFYGLYSFYAGSGDKPWDTSLFTITGGLFGNESGFTGAISGDNISLVGGEFKAWIGSYNNDIDIIKGGVFHYDPSADVAEGYEAYQDGNLWKIRKIEGVAKIGTTTYATLAEAVAAVPTTGGEATTITMVADVANATGMSVAAGKNFTVDFNNHTYTLNKPGAGSAGTETIGFQLLQGSTITFKNGTINISEENLAKATIGNNIKRVIQNYANLTLDNMTIDGTNQYDKKDYVVSFNNGTSVIKDTKIKGADASKVIFDVCTWETYVATSVTVSGSSVIDGNIEVSASNNPQTLALTLTGGTHNGSLVMASGADKATITKSDSFSENAPEGYSWKSNDNGTSTLAANVAKIGESYYATLADAVAAAGDGQTITVLSDIDVPATIAVAKNVTIDLNGNKLYNTTDLWNKDNGTWSVFSVREGGNLTVTGNGTIDAKENDCYAFDVRDGGILNIKNGTFTGNISCVYLINEEDTGVSTCNIEGGTFSLKQLQSGGDGYRFLLNCLDDDYKNNYVRFNVTGGTFVNFNPANNLAEGDGTNFVANGYVATHNGNVWVVEKAQANYWIDCAADSFASVDDNNKIIEIATAAQLAKLSKDIKEHDTNPNSYQYTGYTFKLIADIDLAGKIWTPIGGDLTNYYSASFRGTFDGDGHIISNMHAVGGVYSGLFGPIHTGMPAVIKNLKIDNFKVESNHYAGAIVAWMENATNEFTITECTVSNGTITSSPEYTGDKWDNGDKAGGLVGYLSNPSDKNAVSVTYNEVSNVDIIAYRDFGGLVGCATKKDNCNIYVTNNAISNVNLYQDNTHPYKAPEEITTYDALVGRGSSSITSEDNTVTDVTKYTGTPGHWTQK